MITRTLAEAVEMASSRSAEEQATIASLIMEELEAEAKWDASFAKSQDKLASLARKALDEHRAGLTKPLPNGE